jgi:hypothetical protein
MWRSIEESARLEIVEAAGGIHEAVDDKLPVGTAVAGINSVPGNCVAQSLEGRVFVVEGFHENGFQFPGAGGGG